MAYKDLHDFIRVIEKEGRADFVRVKVEVDAELEITEIADRVSKKLGPGILFENVKGSQFPVLINAMGTYKRMNMALGVEHLDDIGAAIKDLVDVQSYLGIRKLFKKIPVGLRMLNVFPIKSRWRRGACQEVVNMDPNLNDLPVLKCWPLDGGKFFTLPLVMTKDPETGTQNTGMYRLQVFDAKTTGMHWHLHKDGRQIYEKYRKIGGRMPVSVALGCDPAITYAATAPLPKLIDEMMFAGWLRKKNVRMVKSKTNDIYVPADAEFIIEGYVDVNEALRLEGPFGDHTGYYSLSDDYPAFHVTCITHKKDAIYPTTIVGQPPMEDCYLGKATERIFLPLLQMMFPEIVNLNLPLEGVFHNCAIVSIDKRFPGHGRKMMNSLWGMGQMMYTKMIIVVDAGVDPYDLKAVAVQVFGNTCMKEDLVISEGALDALDHASDLPRYGHRLGVDATTKRSAEQHLADRHVCVDAFKFVNRRLADVDVVKRRFPEIEDVHVLGSAGEKQAVIVKLGEKRAHRGKTLIEELWRLELFKQAKLVVTVDGNVKARDLPTVAWKVFNNIDAKRDLVYSEVDGYWRLGVDATKKLEAEGYQRDWPDDIVMSDEIKELVTRRWDEYGIDE
ncbi:MAG: menaquinone biosynthesis decarboxylase [Turicibacter sp.]|nr:menaquinone biosynthesis decarboxylase [Turicibacter sp.]